MKSFLIIVTLLCLVSFVKASDDANIQNLSIFNSEITELNVINSEITNENQDLKKIIIEEKDPKKRSNIFLAIQGYKSWKKQNPDSKQKLKMFKKIFKAVKKERKRIRECKNIKTNEDKEDCFKVLDQRFEEISRDKEYDTYAAIDKNTYISRRRIASGLNKLSCIGWESFHAIAVGRHRGCDVTTYGIGAAIAVASSHTIICASPNTGVNFGPYVKAGALLGGGVGMLFGKSGVCVMVTAELGSLGAMVGAISVNTNFEWR